MQFLMSEDEMNQTREKVSALERLPSVDDLQKFCTFVADNLKLTDGWRAGHAWGCILSQKREWYCDDCPAKNVCPHPYKQWSK